MNRFDMVALCAAICITLLAMGRIPFSFSLYLQHASSVQWAIWILGEIVITYGPIAAAALCWRWSGQTRWPALPHLLFLPLAMSLFWGGQSLLLAATDVPDFDDTIGAPVMPGAFLFLIASGLYVGALMHRAATRWVRQPST